MSQVFSRVSFHVDKRNKNETKYESSFPWNNFISTHYFVEIHFTYKPEWIEGQIYDSIKNSKINFALSQSQEKHYEDIKWHM